MINTIKRLLPILGLKNMTSDDLIRKGVEKINPRFKQFFSEAGKYGYPLGAALGFLSSEFGGSSKPSDDMLRPDEQANQEIQRQNQFPNRIAGAVGNVAGGAALGGLGGAAISGLANTKPQPQQPPSQQQGYDPLAGLQKYPELVKFIQSEASSGGNASSIASKARKQAKLADMVSAIENEAGEEFEGLLARLIGQPQQAAQQKPQTAQAKLAELIQAYKAGRR